MGEDRDYDEVVGKVPRRDRDGNDVTGDSLSSGGRRRPDGTLSGVAYDLELRDDKDRRDPPDLAAEILKAALVIGTTVAVTLAVEHGPTLRAWLDRNMVTPVRARVRRLTTSGTPVEEQGTALDLALPDGIELADLSHEIEFGLKDDRILMGETEAKQRFLEILLALSIVAENMSALQNAVVVDDGKLLELQRVADMLASERGVDLLNRMLEPASTPLNAVAQAEFVRVFGGGGEVDGRYLPLRRELIGKSLRLPNRGM